ncbi:hypothetical protein M422DRAFT_263030 [Sphaerobolus stellatus SS14]|uniref:Uncharacterized protein n=1 Tax=Sphaerobolus stellatus (strain SS14) TaxID=990650 RepID=A0A0C9UJ06_SPHS4|nr:hypothetical protein M422DRAFT_263030 [Sphaerobolus stellatus SS14]
MNPEANILPHCSDINPMEYTALKEIMSAHLEEKAIKKGEGEEEEITIPIVEIQPPFSTKNRDFNGLSSNIDPAGKAKEPKLGPRDLSWGGMCNSPLPRSNCPRSEICSILKEHDNLRGTPEIEEVAPCSVNAKHQPSHDGLPEILAELLSDMKCSEMVSSSTIERAENIRTSLSELRAVSEMAEYIPGYRLSIKKNDIKRARQIRIYFATDVLLPVIVKNTYGKLGKPGICDEDKAYFERVDELLTSIDHILSESDEDENPPYEALTQCYDSLSQIITWLAPCKCGYRDPMTKRATEDSSSKWWEDEGENEIQGDNCWETSAKGPTSFLSLPIRLINHLAQFMESAFAIINGLISFATRFPIRNIDISAIARRNTIHTSLD